MLYPVEEMIEQGRRSLMALMGLPFSEPSAGGKGGA